MIGPPHHVVIDCPEHGLAAFYSEVLGLPTPASQTTLWS